MTLLRLPSDDGPAAGAGGNATGPPSGAIIVDFERKALPDVCAPGPPLLRRLSEYPQRRRLTGCGSASRYAQGRPCSAVALPPNRAKSGRASPVSGRCARVLKIFASRAIWRLAHKYYKKQFSTPQRLALLLSRHLIPPLKTLQNALKTATSD